MYVSTRSGVSGLRAVGSNTGEFRGKMAGVRADVEGAEAAACVVTGEYTGGTTSCVDRVGIENFAYSD